MADAAGSGNPTGTGSTVSTGARRAKSWEWRRSVVIAGVGVVLTTVYAAVMLLQILVWNPLAAAPTGLTLAEIYATMEAEGQRWPTVPIWEFGMAGLGIALCVALLGVTSAVRRPRPMLVATLVATIIAFGAPPTSGRRSRWGCPSRTRSTSPARTPRPGPYLCTSRAASRP